MGFQYKPSDAAQTIPAGTYDATVGRVIEKNKEGQPMKSKKGEAMIQVIFDVYVGQTTRKTSAYFTNVSTLYRYKDLAGALGQADGFKAGNFDVVNHIGDPLRLELSIEDSAAYGEQNNIDKFHPAAMAAVKRDKPEPIEPDDIPF